MFNPQRQFLTAQQRAAKMNKALEKLGVDACSVCKTSSSKRQLVESEGDPLICVDCFAARERQAERFNQPGFGVWS